MVEASRQFRQQRGLRRWYDPAVATVYLHIGTMKSGSSFLQSTCGENRRALSTAGIRYVGTRRSWRAVQDLKGGRVRRDVGAWRRLARQLRTSTSDSLISNELLCQIPEQLIREVVSSLAPHEVQVIVTVRDITKVVPSHWQERIQNGSLVGWTEFCETACADPSSTDASRTFWGHHDVVQVISKWSNVLTADRITVVTVPPSSENPELLWGRFLSALGASSISTKPATRANPSLGAVSAELLLRVNAQLTDFPRHDRSVSVKGPLAKRTLAKRARVEPRYALTPDHFAILRARAVVLADGIRTAGVQVIGDLDDIVPAAEPPTGAKPGEVTDSQLLEAAVSGLAGMCRELAKRRSVLDKLERERDSLLAERPRPVREQQEPVDAQGSLGRRALRSVRGSAARAR
jgi:Ni,Fe-hydrogenase III small subunit